MCGRACGSVSVLLSGKGREGMKTSEGAMKVPGKPNGHPVFFSL